jgi:hypothetical protein
MIGLIFILFFLVAFAKIYPWAVGIAAGLFILQLASKKQEVPQVKSNAPRSKSKSKIVK